MRGPLALLPEWGSSAGVVPRQQQGPGCTLSEPRSEQRGPPNLLGHDVAKVGRVEDKQLRPGRLALRVGDAQDHAIVARHRGPVEPESLADARSDREGPRRVHLHAVRGMKDDPPVSELVTKALHHQGSVVRHVSGRLFLVVDERHEVVDGAVVEPSEHGAGAGIRRRTARNLASKLTDRAPEFGRATDAVALPEWHLARLPERG